MSERAPAPAPAPVESAPETSDYVEWAEGRGATSETPTGSAAVDRTVDAIDAAVPEANPEAEALMDGVDNLIPANPTPEATVEPANILDLTEKEKAVKLLMETVKLTELRTSIREVAIPAVNRLDRGMDKARDVRDMAIKKGLLLEYREKATGRKASRVEAALERATPGTARYRRLSKKLGKLNINLGNVRASIGRLEATPKERTKENERVEKLRVKEIQRRRDILRIEKKVAVEKANRRKMKEDAEREGDSDIGKQLKEKINSWKRIGEFRKELMHEAMTQYKANDKEDKNRAKDKPKQGDYELAA